MSCGFETFIYDGAPIQDIRAWAKERGERMIRYRAHRTWPDIHSGTMVDVERFGEMPESFFNNLLMDNWWTYTELEGGEDETARVSD